MAGMSDAMKRHVANIFEKLHVQSRRVVIQQVAEHGMLKETARMCQITPAREEVASSRSTHKISANMPFGAYLQENCVHPIKENTSTF